MGRFFKSIWFTSRFFIISGAVIAILVTGHFFDLFFRTGQVLLAGLGLALIMDIILLYNTRKGLSAERTVPEKLSNGDQNQIQIQCKNHYGFPVRFEMIDEIPHQFQVRDFRIRGKIPAQTSMKYRYELRPVRRGEYLFGNLNIFVTGAIGLISRRYIFNKDHLVPVYPSFIQMRKFELLAISNRLSEAGVKKIRALGRQAEFDQIRKYIIGDDYRAINWKATARKTEVMVNQYQDEKSQQIYSLIDMGRIMKMPFKEMTLLDYAINTSLVISNIAMQKHDKAGLLTFSHKIHSFLPAERRNNQLLRILDTLYKQETDFSETDFEQVYAFIKRKISHRSLLLVFTNFESIVSMRRQLPFLKRLSDHHLVVAVFFENTEIRSLLSANTLTLEDIYIKTIAEKLVMEKKQIVKELNRSGIHTILSPPAQLSVNTINKYLELKARGII
jgi:uncharacterized protein (DUF58 family)